MIQVKVLLGMLLMIIALGLSISPGSAAAQDKGYAEGDMVLGSENAPVTVIEYASYTCPACANFHNTTFSDFKEKYVDTGKVRFIFREFIRNQLDLAAALLARCAGPDSFYGITGMIFRQQSSWMDAEDKLASLQQIGRFAGVSQERWQACLKDEALANKILETTQKAMQEHKVDATPTFIVNGEKHTGSLSLDEFDKVLAKHLP